MAQPFDGYRDWLGIAETIRPLNNYQVLRLTLFEDDAAKIRERYRKMHEHVRQYIMGKHAAEARALLNELARAMLCLTDARRKQEYDTALGRVRTETERRRTLEEILLADKLLTPEQIAAAQDYANAIGLSLRDAVLQQHLATPEAITQAYAESQGLPYIVAGELAVDVDVAAQYPAVLARQYSCVPVMVEAGRLLVASANPLAMEVEEDLRLRYGMPLRTILCAPAGLNVLVTRHYSRDAVSSGKSGVLRKGGAKERAPTTLDDRVKVLGKEEDADQEDFEEKPERLQPEPDAPAPSWAADLRVQAAVLGAVFGLLGSLLFRQTAFYEDVFSPFSLAWAIGSAATLCAFLLAGVAFMGSK